MEALRFQRVADLLRDERKENKLNLPKQVSENHFTKPMLFLFPGLVWSLMRRRS